MRYETGPGYEAKEKCTQRLSNACIAGALTGIAAILLAAPGISAQSPPPIDPPHLTDPPPPSPGRQIAANFCADCIEPPAANPQASVTAMSPQLMIAAEDARILQLAAQLKVEVDQCRADTLQADVVRKANLIRWLARNLKHEIKLTLQRK